MISFRLSVMIASRYHAANGSGYCRWLPGTDSRFSLNALLSSQRHGRDSGPARYLPRGISTGGRQGGDCTAGYAEAAWARRYSTWWCSLREWASRASVTASASASANDQPQSVHTARAVGGILLERRAHDGLRGRQGRGESETVQPGRHAGACPGVASGHSRRTPRRPSTPLDREAVIGREKNVNIFC